MRRSRKPVWAVPSIEGSNPSLSARRPETYGLAGHFVGALIAAGVPGVRCDRLWARSPRPGRVVARERPSALDKPVRSCAAGLGIGLAGFAQERCPAFRALSASADDGAEIPVRQDEQVFASHC